MNTEKYVKLKINKNEYIRLKIGLYTLPFKRLGSVIIIYIFLIERAFIQQKSIK